MTIAEVAQVIERNLYDFDTTPHYKNRSVQHIAEEKRVKVYDNLTISTNYMIESSYTPNLFKVWNVKSQIANVTEVVDQYPISMFEAIETSKFFNNIGYPVDKTQLFKGESTVMKRRKLTNEELQRKIKRVLEANENSTRTIFSTDQEILEFVNNCEKVYRKSTIDHLVSHEQRRYEGNVDERRWYRFGKYLQDKGLLGR
ncbi:hypothetical protein BAU22_16840 [Bacillus sp. 4048]|uniref:hypothetical protein n=1 Tax=Bacillus TaxID=1386 RepID=UPI0008FDE145|nr:MULTISPECIES: hypothetical protein [Bacillus]OJD46188.1 hypothetical protein BAU22_16840 [Bacillus sp. 4048]TCD27558.1 hypothetical protein E0D84_28865 [Bacillus wiedmannii]